MLALNPQTSHTLPLKPNLLPASIKHSGLIPTASRHWKPDPNNTTAYFRGRKLRGKVVKLRGGYTGVVLKKTGEVQPQQQQERPIEEDEEDGEEETQEVKTMETMGTFNEIVIWGHEALPDEEDVYIKGVREWIGFAEAMHTYDPPTQDKS